MDGVASVSGTGIIEESLQISLKQEKIDKLNNRILKSIDGKLSQTKAELDKAEKALQDGKVKFNEESDKQKEKLLEGSMSLSSGKSQVEQGLKLLIQGQEELEKKRDEIKKEKGKAPFKKIDLDKDQANVDLGSRYGKISISSKETKASNFEGVTFILGG